MTSGASVVVAVYCCLNPPVTVDSPDPEPVHMRPGLTVLEIPPLNTGEVVPYPRRVSCLGTMSPGSFSGRDTSTPRQRVRSQATGGSNTIVRPRSKSVKAARHTPPVVHDCNLRTGRSIDSSDWSPPRHTVRTTQLTTRGIAAAARWLMARSLERRPAPARRCNRRSAFREWCLHLAVWYLVFKLCARPAGGEIDTRLKN